MNRSISTIKDYQTLIIVLPAIAGGIYQIYMILSILGFSYLRYFSVAQVIPDGLIALVFFGYIFIIYYVIQFMYKNLSYTGASIDGDTKLKLYIPVGAVLIFFIFILLNGVDIGNYVSVTKFFFDLTVLNIAYFSLFFLIYLVKDFCLDLVSSSIGGLEEGLILVLQFFIYVVFFIIIFQGVPSAFKKLNSEINRNSNFYNFEKLAIKVQKEYNLNGKPQHVYTNKDYVFYSININEKINFIAIDTKELTSFDFDDQKD